MSDSTEKNNYSAIIQLLNQATRYYVLIINNDLITNISELEYEIRDKINIYLNDDKTDDINTKIDKNLTPVEIVNTLNIDLERILRFHGYYINASFSDREKEIYFWGEKNHKYQNLLPDLMEMFFKISPKVSNKKTLSEQISDDPTAQILKTTLSELYNAFAVNIADDFLFSYLIGTIVKLLDAEVGLLQIKKGEQILNFSMGFKQSSLSNLKYDNLPVFDYLLKNKKPILVPHTSTDPHFSINIDEAGLIKSLLFFPIFNKGEMVAVIYLINKSYSANINYFNEYDMQLLTTLTIQIGSVITNALLYKKTIELKEFNEEVLENIPSGILTTSPQQKVLFMNRYMRDLLVILQIKENDLITIIEEQHSGNSYHGEMSLELKERTVYLKITKKYLMITTELSIYLYNILDITQEKEIEKQLRKTEKLAVAGELISGIAHEIKNPLTSMKGFADLLFQRIDDRDFILKFASIVASEINRLNMIIERFLSFAKPDISNMSNVDIYYVISDAKDIVSYNLDRKNVEFNNKIDRGLIINGNREMLIQIFINLFLNSIQALEDSKKSERIISLYYNLKNSYLEISVEDNGPGISQENIDKIFNPFFTTKPKGSGLGLSITHKIITEHNGHIHIESKMGEFTRSILKFPLVKVNNEADL